MRILSVIWCCCLVAFGLHGQNFSYRSSDVVQVPHRATVNVANIRQKWSMQLQNLEAPAPGGGSYQAFLAHLKATIPGTHASKRQTNTLEPLGSAQDPTIGQSFDGNPRGGAPNDNDLSISNDGILISVINSNIIFYDTENDTLLQSIELSDFADTLGLTAHMYDPRTIYDPKQDKFIIVFLSGSTDSTSNIVVAFSETNDPMGNWNLYALPGDQLDGATWTDYPMIAITDDELFISGNALINDTIHTSDSWKYLFKESIIWQINKQSGYTGQTLTYKYHYNIRYGGQPIRNLCPVRGGSTTYGPDIYFLSNRNFDLVNDTIFLLHITGLYNDTQSTLTVDVQKCNQPYGLAPDVAQPNTYTLQTNDSRVLSAYTEDGLIHFVGNTILPDTQLCGIMHGIINLFDNSDSVDARILGEPNMSYGYPNIAYSGKYRYDDEAIISFNYASEDTFPGFAAIFYDGRTGYSDRIALKTGESYVKVITGKNQRWGDYSGSQTKYNEPGVVWADGYYGKLIQGNPFNVNANVTWIAEISSPDTTDFSAIQEPVSAGPQVKAYPNPTVNRVSVEFKLQESTWLIIALYDLDGRLVKTFIDDEVKAGTNLFSFDTAPLSAGTYVLQIRSDAGTLVSKKLVKQ